MDQPNPEFKKSGADERRNGTTVLTPDESRQGVMTGRIRWVLAISTSLTVIAFVVLYAVFS